MTMFRSILILILAFQLKLGFAEEIQYKPSVEYGFLAVLNHRIQFSQGNTYFDYVEDGGQDNLYEYERYTVDVLRKNDFMLRFVYQPIDLITSETLDAELRVDNVSFAAGTPMNFRYSFPYYRASYLWNMVADEKWQVYGGLGLQFRNAIINFESQDGSQALSSRDVGLVPLFALYATYNFSPESGFTFEAEGNYADTSFLNGDDESEVKGALIDTALGFESRISEKITVFSKIRYVSGGSEGTSDEKDNPGSDGYNSNWIDLFSFNLGLMFHLENL